MADLYRHFDARGRLLYVGVSITALVRLVQHRARSNWYGQIVRVEIQRFPSRGRALRAERKAIATEKPLFNIQHVKEDCVLFTLKLREDVCVRLDALKAESGLSRQRLIERILAQVIADKAFVLRLE